MAAATWQQANGAKKCEKGRPKKVKNRKPWGPADQLQESKAAPARKVKNQGGKRNPNPNFLVRIFSSGVGVFHVNGWGPKSSIRPSNPGKSNLLGGISREFAGISRGRPKSLRKKSLGSIFVPQKKKGLRPNLRGVPANPAKRAKNEFQGDSETYFWLFLGGWPGLLGDSFLTFRAGAAFDSCSWSAGSQRQLKKCENERKSAKMVEKCEARRKSAKTIGWPFFFAIF